MQSRHAIDHFNWHKSDFPEISDVEGYIEAAHEFRELASLRKITEKGNLAFFDEETGGLLLTELDGTPQSFFVPEEPRVYFDGL